MDPSLNQVQAPKPPVRSFYGSFKHAVDKGRRVMVPFRWRSRLREEFMVLAWPLEQSVCLKVLTLEKSETAFKACGDEPLTDDKAGKFNRAIGCSSAVEELDESGRLLLREDLTQRVGIKNEAVLVGCRSCFEIWAPETFEANLSDTLSSGAATAKEKNI